MNKYLVTFLVFLFGIVISIPTLLPLFNQGFFTVHDNTQVERVFQMTKSLSEGHFPARWVDDLGYGYGYPIYNFYAPLPYYLGGFINLIINNSLLSTKILFAVGIVGSFFSMYLFASRLTNRLGGLVAGVLYLYFPYHAVNIYIRGAVGEFFAYVFTPLVFLGIYSIYKYLKNKKEGKLPLFTTFFSSIPLALVIISHNLSAYMLGLFLVPYILFLIIRISQKRLFIYSVSIMFFVSFLLSSFYVLPVIFESSFTNVQSQIGGGAYYVDHFVCLGQLLNSNWGFGGSIPGCVDGLSFRLGTLNIIIVTFALLYGAINYFKNRKITQESIYWVLLLLSLILTTPYSRPIWDNLYYMEFLQYPWRFLNFSALFISIIVAFFIGKIYRGKIALVVSILFVLGTVYLNYKLFVPVSYVDHTNSYYENIEHIRFETSKISDEYMPDNFDKPMDESEVTTEILEIESDRVSIMLTNARTGYLEFLKEGEETRVHINKAYFPSWSAYVNGERVEIREENNGMSILLGEGRKNVVIKFEQTLIQSIGNGLTVIGIIAVFAAIIVKRRRLDGSARQEEFI